MNTRKKIIQFLISFFIYLVFSFVIHKPLWKELKFDNSKIGAVHAEITAVEWGQENLYKNIKSFKNPFSSVEGFLYPFGTNLLTSDSGNGFFFIFLRPFFSPHQANVIIWISQVILANLGMFLLLNILGISTLISFFIGLAYGYMTFLVLRIGHMTYFSIYVFPWFYLFLVKLISQKKGIFAKILLSIGVSIIFTLSLYHNLYYFIMLGMSLIILVIYYLIFDKKSLLKIFLDNIIWILLIIVSFIILISPWLKILYETYLFEGLPKVEGWGGAIQFSSDLLGFFIPSSYGYFLGKYSDLISSKFVFSSSIFENFSYPGLIIIFAYVGGFLLYKFKKILSKDLKNIFPILFVAFSFWILILGPFLHVFGKWGITLDEGIRVVFPLPYVFLHEIPFLNNIRSPGRFIVPFIFFSYIFSAFIMNFYLKNKNKIFKIIFFCLLFFIFIIDQYFVYSPPASKYYPIKAYKKIAEDTRKISVMEAPSMVRDGFVYFGDEGGFNYFYGQPIYNKPVLAGYFGRIPSFKRDYYIRNPLLGYVGRLMDENINLNGGFDKTDLESWKTMNESKALDAANFLDVGYYLIDEEKSYTATLSANFSHLGFKKIMNDKNFSLWRRDVEKKEFLKVILGYDDDMYLGMGWGNKEIDGRWSDNKTSVLFKVILEDKFNLNFTAKSFYKDIPVNIYLDRKKIARTTISTTKSEFTFALTPRLKEGIHTIYFIFDKSYRPSDIDITNSDKRELSAKFSQVSLEKQ